MLIFEVENPDVKLKINKTFVCICSQPRKPQQISFSRKRRAPKEAAPPPDFDICLIFIQVVLDVTHVSI